LDKKNSYEGLYVYHQKDIQMIRDYLDTVTAHGVAAARQLGSMATILESGKSLESYLKQKGSDKNGTTEQDEQGSENAV
jgi:hypothetical protein